jgi:hypothetical protein
MTEKQKVKIFRSMNGKSAIDQINEFISDPKINAIGIAMSDVDVMVLYEEN